MTVCFLYFHKLNDYTIYAGRERKENIKSSHGCQKNVSRMNFKSEKMQVIATSPQT